ATGAAAAGRQNAKTKVAAEATTAKSLNKSPNKTPAKAVSRSESKVAAKAAPKTSSKAAAKPTEKSLSKTAAKQVSLQSKAPVTNKKTDYQAASKVTKDAAKAASKTGVATDAK